MNARSGSCLRLSTGERGFSLAETMVGMSILLVVASGVLPLGIVTLRMSENQGHLAARASEYAQDKLEQLLSLPYGDTVSDTRSFPAAATGGSGLRPGGNLTTPVLQYVDYLDHAGTLLDSTGAAPPGWFYQRLWQIEEVGTPDANCPISVSAAQVCLKRITVTATTRRAHSGGSLAPRVTVVALKSYPF